MAELFLRLEKQTTCHELLQEHALRSAARRVSHAVRNTSRGARSRILIKYGIVRSGSYFAVSRRSQPRPFWTMSSLVGEQRFGKLYDFREEYSCPGTANQCNADCAAAPADLATWLHRNTFLTRAGFAATIGEIR